MPDQYVPHTLMENRNTLDRLIATADLTSVDVPPPEADLGVLETFCLTVDGYEGGRHSVEDLVSQANHLEQDGLENPRSMNCG